MKTGISFLLVLLCVSFSSDLQRKVIRNNGFDIECYVSPKKLKSFNNNKTYYWFKSGEIHQSLSSSGGYVLHNNYSKYYRSKQLVEQGAFSYGLKIGDWKTWHKNGKIQVVEKWIDGHKNGPFKVFDSLGKLIIKGTYKNSLKTGYWIDYEKMDTTYHKNNDIFKERPKNLVERMLRKKDSLEKNQIKHERIVTKRNDSIKKIKLKQEKLIKKRNDSLKKIRAKAEKIKQKKLDSLSKSKSPKKGFFDRLLIKK